MYNRIKGSDTTMSSKSKLNKQNSFPQEEGNGNKKKSPLFPKLSKALLIFPLPILVILIYILSGFIYNTWHPLWIIFLAIPAYYHFAIALRAKSVKGLLLGLPVPEVALILFLVLGVTVNAWKFAWVLFILAGLYYWLIAAYVKKR